MDIKYAIFAGTAASCSTCAALVPSGADTQALHTRWHEQATPGGGTPPPPPPDRPVVPEE